MEVALKRFLIGEFAAAAGVNIVKKISQFRPFFIAGCSETVLSRIS
jgi:hypothetical protein